jgi:SPX domain protein involved in polyphosphate accumulation
MDGHNTSKTKLSFNLPGEKNNSMQGKWADLNPFEALNEENESFAFLKKISKELEGVWTFQGKKKNKVRTDAICSEGDQSPHPTT